MTDSVYCLTFYDSDLDDCRGRESVEIDEGVWLDRDKARAEADKRNLSAMQAKFQQHLVGYRNRRSRREKNRAEHDTLFLAGLRKQLFSVPEPPPLPVDVALPFKHISGRRGLWDSAERICLHDYWSVEEVIVNDAPEEAS